MKTNLEPNQRCGRLTLIERKHKYDNKHVKRAYWLCTCDCGATTNPGEDALKRGLTRSCGCLHREVASFSAKNLKGRKFGRLTVIERIGSDKNRAATWLVRCECGLEKSIRGTGLTYALTESCGCLQKETVSLPSGVSLLNIILRGYINSAKARKLVWELTNDEFYLLTQGDCHYCGIPPMNTKTKERYVGSFTYNGIDRVNNSEGYTLDNSVSCCMDCNDAKGAMSLDRFIRFVKRAGKFQLKCEKTGTV